MIIISACLAGIKCRYDGNDNLVPELKQLVLKGKALPLCPEELGGLPTPRIPCEMVSEDNHLAIQTREGIDVTAEFREGARKVAEIARILDCQTAILKSRSPSCGCGKVYDGTFSGKLIPGKGLCAEMLDKQGVRILNEENYQEHPSVLQEK